MYYTHGTFKLVRPNAGLTPEKISVSEVRQKSSSIIPRLWKNFNKLQTIIERHERSIQRRWKKKPKAKRHDALRRAWGSSPPIATKHRPDVGCVRNQHRNIGPAERSYFMWPTINLEDLGKTEPLLLLLNSRGRYPPSTFAFTDLEHAMFGYRVGAMIGPPFLDRWNMRFIGRNSANLSPGEGLWLLEIQDRLYQFLLDICKIILHDMDLGDEHLQALPIIEEPPLPTDNHNGDAATTSLMITRYEAAYHIPSKLDVRKIKSLIDAKLSQAEDRLWALREDPSFFASKILEIFEHRLEHVLGPNGKPHPNIEIPDPREAIIALVAMQVATYYMCDIEVWAFMNEHVDRLAILKEKHFDSADAELRPEDDLPTGLAVELFTFMAHIEQFLDPFLTRAERLAKASPTLRHLFRCDPDELSIEAFNNEVDVNFRDSYVKRSKLELEYLWVLKNMSDQIYRKHMGVHACVEELERIARDSKTRQLITSHMAEYFSDICIMTECKRQIELFQPWASTFDLIMEEKARRERLMQMSEHNTNSMKPMLDFRLTYETSKLGAAIAETKYPVDKRPTKSNIEAMRAAEAALDSFWEAVITELRQADLWKGRIKEILLHRQPERTPPWVDAPRTNKKVSSDNTTVETFVGTSQGQHSEPSSRPVTESKVKQKTRPLQQHVQEDVADETENGNPLDDEEQPPQRIFEVDKRSKKVFNMLFYVPFATRSRLPGEIPWADFLYAMHYVGFGIEKLGGSSWQFTPGAALDGEEYARGIQFHEPHPSDKIRFRMARLYGRRLARAYGWCGEMFREEGSEA
ncbi:hypothetical protein F5Y13DRAFT_187750 [Hypoxylon sp. FL1857]|nr:hypothetical protein F5Y13DRAFT_187750 [Hypoxylon sp. FL1857]